jgi:hypothetical protein
MAAVDPQGGEKYWIEGVSFEGIRNQQTNTGEEKCTYQGKSEQNLFPLNNGDTGNFFLLFD